MDEKDFRTVSELVEDYLSERLPRPATCQMYREVAQRWVNDTGNDVVEMISTEDVREWRGAVLARPPAIRPAVPQTSRRRSASSPEDGW